MQKHWLHWIVVTTLWAIVALIIVYVDPEMLRDVGVEGLYLPMIVLLTIAFAYPIILLTTNKNARVKARNNLTNESKEKI